MKTHGDAEVGPVEPVIDAGEDAEIELLADGDRLDEVDAAEANWAPGEPPPGVPADEVLHVRPLTGAEPSADLLDVPDGDDQF